MIPGDIDADIEVAIGELQLQYMNYMKSLKRVLDFGERIVHPLVGALNHKHANAVAKALGLTMYSKVGAESGIPALLDWLIVQSPMYPDVLEALVRAGDTVQKELATRLKIYAEKDDDEAVRNVLDLATRMSGLAVGKTMPAIVALLSHPKPDIREAASDAVSRIGLPQGSAASGVLKHIASEDPVPSVRNAATAALIRLGEA